MNGKYEITVAGSIRFNPLTSISETTSACATKAVPQISAVMNAYSVAMEYDIPVIADGGIKYSGDLPKAIAAGANVIMVGSLLAGCEEAPGATEIYQGRQFKVYRGMGSLAAMEKGSKDRYFQENARKLVPEGVEGRVPYKGPLADTVFQMMGGLRAGMGYCGAANVEELKKNGKFVKRCSASRDSWNGTLLGWSSDQDSSFCRRQHPRHQRQSFPCSSSLQDHS